MPVASDYKFGSDVRADLFAATPPLEAIRLVLSHASTATPGRERRRIMANDVKRAYFRAPCDSFAFHYQLKTQVKTTNA